LPQLLAQASERVRAFSCHSCHENYETYLSLVVQQLRGRNPPDKGRRAIEVPAGPLVGRACELILKRKRFGMDVLAAPPWQAWREKYPARSAEIRQLLLLDRQIVAKRWGGPGAEGVQVHRELIAGWLEQRERLEERLTRDVPELARRRRLRAASLSSIAEELPAGWALVEIAWFRECDFRTLFTRTEANSLPGRYVAFVLKAGSGVSGRLIDLGPAPGIDSLVAAWRQETLAGPSRCPAPARTIPGDAGQTLRAAVIDPLLPLVEGCRGLVIAPDGELLYAPLDALPLGDGCLLDRFECRQVMAGRHLLEWRRDAGLPRGNPVVVGETEPVFWTGETDSDAGGGAPEVPLPVPAKGGGLLSGLWAGVRRALGGKPVSPPPGNVRQRGLEPASGTWEEAEEVARVLGVGPLLGEEGSAARILGQQSPAVLHLAAPAFFLAEKAPPGATGKGPTAEQPPAKQPAATEGSIGLRSAGTVASEDTPAERTSPPGWVNPLYRSGLTLAASETLTAFDVTTMGLLGTDLVVLSACETPAGQPMAWATVSGLVGACVQAGARNVVLSLWRAPEAARRELLLAFYRGLKEGKAPAEALQEARREVRSRRPEPCNWAGWVCVGP
jgi:hypothetical protein